MKSYLATLATLGLPPPTTTTYTHTLIQQLPTLHPHTLSLTRQLSDIRCNAPCAGQGMSRASACLPCRVFPDHRPGSEGPRLITETAGPQYRRLHKVGRERPMASSLPYFEFPPPHTHTPPQHIHTLLSSPHSSPPPSTHILQSVRCRGAVHY